ncbi:MAG: lipid-A-disaccharide synthase [Lentisphaerae bacterium GWF2_44_16]|nr:MAG: lipid-A-disaccharide synthase [Lentisphaerae bacterium GWF2_44_16]
MNEKYKIWILAGEASGDIYGARLSEEIRKLTAGKTSVSISGMGGPEMKKAGVDILVDSTELGVVGLFEIGMMIFKFIGIFRYLERKAAEEKPDAVILVDYPGFNIRFAKSMYKKGIPVIWYISPQVWAWRKSNIPKLAKYCAKMLVIFPFEPETYKGTGLDVEFTGHPLVDVVAERGDASIERQLDTVLLLPGSRGGEIKRLLVPMLETVSLLKKKNSALKFVISAPNEKIFSMVREMYDDFQRKNPDLPGIEISCGRTAYWQQAAGTGLAASGTVTVECAIAGLPLVVVYKLNPFTFLLARMLITLFRGFFTMVNIIAYKVVFEEFLQKNVRAELLVPAMERIMPGGARREDVEKDMLSVKDALSAGSKGASFRAAEACVDFFSSGKLK